MLNSFVEPISIKLFKIAAIEKLSMAHTRRKSFFDLQNISSKIKTKQESDIEKSLKEVIPVKMSVKQIFETIWKNIWCYKSKTKTPIQRLYLKGMK